MKFFNKRGIELAANTIVLLLVSIVILGLALSLSYGVFCGAQEYSQEVDAQSQAQLERLLSSGGKVQVADNTKTAKRQGSGICGGQSTVGAQFTLGIQNQDLNEKTLEIEIYDSQGVRADNVQYFPGPGEEFTIPARDSYTTNILFSLDLEPTETQVYSIRVVDTSGSIYGIQQVYLNP